jgi:hypothetical protein
VSGDRRPAPDRRLSPDEARAYLDAPITDAERDAVRDLVRWFRRRYPTPVERLTYVRRAYARWRRTQGLAARSPPDTPP